MFLQCHLMPPAERADPGQSGTFAQTVNEPNTKIRNDFMRLSQRKAANSRFQVDVTVTQPAPVGQISDHICGVAATITVGPWARMRYHQGCLKPMEKPAVNPEDRLVDIEIKIARQEDLLDALNTLVYRQQQKIDQLETLCAALARLIKGAPDATDERNPADERPPHY
jgi:SlyX protein